METAEAVKEVANTHPEWLPYLRLLVERGDSGPADDVPREAMAEFQRLGLIAYYPNGGG